MKLRSQGIIRATPAADYSAYEGYGVTLSVVAGILTATLSASATAPIEGIIVEAGTVAQGVSILIPGNESGSCHVKLSGTVAAGEKIQQAADGTFVTDAAAGARSVIGLAFESGVSGDLIEVFPYTPLLGS